MQSFTMVFILFSSLLLIQGSVNVKIEDCNKNGNKDYVGWAVEDDCWCHDRKEDKVKCPKDQKCYSYEYDFYNVTYRHMVCLLSLLCNEGMPGDAFTTHVNCTCGYKPSNLQRPKDNFGECWNPNKCWVNQDKTMECRRENDYHKTGECDFEKNHTVSGAWAVQPDCLCPDVFLNERIKCPKDHKCYMFGKTDDHIECLPTLMCDEGLPENYDDFTPHSECTCYKFWNHISNEKPDYLGKCQPGTVCWVNNNKEDVEMMCKPKNTNRQDCDWYENVYYSGWAKDPNCWCRDKESEPIKCPEGQKCSVRDKERDIKMECLPSLLCNEGMPGNAFSTLENCTCRDPTRVYFSMCDPGYKCWVKPNKDMECRNETLHRDGDCDFQKNVNFVTNWIFGGWAIEDDCWCPDVIVGKRINCPEGQRCYVYETQYNSTACLPTLMCDKDLPENYDDFTPHSECTCHHYPYKIPDLTPVCFVKCKSGTACWVNKTKDSFEMECIQDDRHKPPTTTLPPTSDCGWDESENYLGWPKDPNCWCQDKERNKIKCPEGQKCSLRGSDCDIKMECLPSLLCNEGMPGDKFTTHKNCTCSSEGETESRYFLQCDPGYKCWVKPNNNMECKRSSEEGALD